jgi:imidazolonepropionase-like amidohydrolase
MRRFLRFLVTFVLVAAVAVYLLVVWPLRDKHPSVRLADGAIAVRAATIYVSPGQPPLNNATLVARNGRIVAVGSDVTVPTDAQTLPCNGCTVTAGFWNTHVHFTQEKWLNAAWQGREKLNAQLADMLSSRGFTTVADLGSDLRVTVSLRRRIETGELNGPFIYTAGSPIYPEEGIPFYLRETLPKYILMLMLQPSTPAEAIRDEERNIRTGADALKLFTGSHVERGSIKPMRKDIARAAVEVAHRHGQIAFAHPSNLEGIRVALSSTVDVLAHAPDSTDGIDDAQIAEMARKATLIPTLKMFATTVTTDPAFLDPIYDVVRRFHSEGGNLMFGTDVGYMADYSTAEEFAALEKCGLSSTDILRMLTSAAAMRFGAAGQKGTLEPGKLADFVLLGSDPAKGAKAFADVQMTVRSGKVVWRSANE